MRSSTAVGRLRPIVVVLVVFSLLLGMPGVSRAGAPARALQTEPTLGGTIVYHEISDFETGPTHGGEQSPIISDDGQHLAYSVSPGTGDPANPNRIFVMDIDGGSPHEVDSYTTLCYCASMIDISADGSKVVSSESVQLRIADGAGGGGRELLSLDSNEINAARISGDGSKVFFRVYRDTSVRGSSPSEPIERGIYVINADGSGLRQIVGPDDMEALGLAPSDFFGSNSATVDASSDGSRIIFGNLYNPDELAGNGLFGVNLDGSGLHDLIGRVAFLFSGAISGDGSTVLYGAKGIDDAEQVGVLPFSGGTPKILIDRADLLPVPSNGVPDSTDRIQLSEDGSLALLGSSGVLADTETGELLALGVPGSTLTLAPGAAQLVGDGLFRATMDAEGDRFLYLAGDAAGVLQLATAERDPADPGLAPVLEAAVEPASISTEAGSAATITAQVESDGTLAGVGARILRNGLRDGEVGEYILWDDGSHGDASAGDGEFTNNGVVTSCCAVVGPRTVRIVAEAQGSDGKRHATAVDFGPFAVTAGA